MPMDSKLEDLQVFYAYLSSSPKCHFEFERLTEIVKTKGLNVFRNVKTRWIDMLTLLKQIGKKFKMLIVKMTVDFGSMEATKANMLNLYDIDTIINLPCIFPMLEFINVLMKFAKGKDYLYVITL
jgi:hypothetical protein